MGLYETGMKSLLFWLVVFALQALHAEEFTLFDVPPEKKGPVVKPKLAADVGGEQVKIENVTAQIKFIKPYTTSDWKVEVELVATEGEPVRFFEDSYWPLDCRIYVLDSNGKPCPRTDKGKSSSFNGIGYDTQCAILEVGKPRKWVYKLNDLFVLKPGVWTLDVRLGVFKGTIGTPSSRHLEMPFTNHIFNLSE